MLDNSGLLVALCPFGVRRRHCTAFVFDAIEWWRVLVAQRSVELEGDQAGGRVGDDGTGTL